MELADLTTHCKSYTKVLAALGSVVAGILHSCSGYAGFWPWLLAPGPPRRRKMTPVTPGKKTRVDRFEPGFAGQSSPSAHWRGREGSGPPGNPGGGGLAVYLAD